MNSFFLLLNNAKIQSGHHVFRIHVGFTLKLHKRAKCFFFYLEYLPKQQLFSENFAKSNNNYVELSHPTEKHNILVNVQISRLLKQSC